MYTSPNMGLKIWNLITDLFSHTQLQSNFAEIDVHNHTSGNGVQVPSGGIADGAITTAKIGANAVTSAQILDGTILAADLAPGVGQLVPFLSGVNATVAVGQLLMASAGGTIVALPTPTLGAVAGVIGWANPATPTLVVPNSGGTILGTGSMQYNSFQPAILGNGTTSVFLADGRYWHILYGQPDSGWVPVAINGGPGFQDVSGGVASLGTAVTSVRLIGDRVTMVGAIGNVQAGGTIVAPTTLMTIPSFARSFVNLVLPTQAASVPGYSSMTFTYDKLTGIIGTGNSWATGSGGGITTSMFEGHLSFENVGWTIFG